VKDLRIHDLRHFATTLLFMDGVPDTIIRKMTGHTSQVMERYKHLDSSFANESVDGIGDRISERIATCSATKAKKETPADKRRAQPPAVPGFIGGADGTRTRDLRAA
jgi:hypothetical protein